MRIMVKTCGVELASLDAEPSWQLPDVLRTLPARFHEKRYSVRAFFDLVELCGENTLSDIGVSDGAMVTIVQSKLPLSLKILSSSQSGDMSVAVCLAASGERLFTFTGLGNPFRGPVTGLSPDGDYAFLASDVDGLVKIWSTASADCLRTLPGFDCPFSMVRFLSCGERVLVTSKDGSARIWSIASGECLHSFTGDADWIRRVVFSPDGERVLITSSGGSVTIWSIASGECVELLSSGKGKGKGKGSFPMGEQFSSDGERVLTSSRESTKIWSVTSGKCLHTITHDGENTNRAMLSPYCEHVLATTSGGLGPRDASAKLWSIESGVCLLTIPLTGLGVCVDLVKFSPDGEHVLVAGREHHRCDEDQIWPQIWCIASGEHLHTLICKGDTLEYAEFSPDCMRALTISQDGGVCGRKGPMEPVEIWQIWSIASGECLQTLTDFKGSVKDAFSLPDVERAAPA